MIWFSDHDMVHCTGKTVKDQMSVPNIVNIRRLKNYSKELLVERLQQTNWEPVMTCNNNNVAWLNFETIMSTIINSIAPAKQCKVKRNSQSWMTSDILEQTKERDKYLRMHRKSKDPVVYKQYCKARNIVQIMVKKHKKNISNIRLLRMKVTVKQFGMC